MASAKQLRMLEDDEESTTSSANNYDDDNNDGGGNDDNGNDDGDDSSGDEETSTSSSLPTRTKVEATAMTSSKDDQAPRPKKRLRIVLGRGTMKKIKQKAATSSQERIGNGVVENGTLPESSATDPDPIPSHASTVDTTTAVAATKGAADTSPPKKKIKLEVQSKQEESRQFVPRASRPEGTSTAVAKSGEASSKEGAVAALKSGEEEKGEAVLKESAEAENPSASIKNEAPEASKPATAAPTKKRRRSMVSTIRMPPISSPGLLVPPGIVRGYMDANGLVSPNKVFTLAMAAAGYSHESRTKNPHRGSSVQRVIDDMYDSDVKFCVNYPELVPDGLFQATVESPPPTAESSKPEGKKSEKQANPTEESNKVNSAAALTGDTKLPPAPASRPKLTLAEQLIKAFQKGSSSNSNGASSPERKRKIRQYSEMIPLSLTLPYPEEYLQNRLEYVKQVNAREAAIVASQQHQEDLERAKMYAEISGETYTGVTTSDIFIPQIPALAAWTAARDITSLIFSAFSPPSSMILRSCAAVEVTDGPLPFFFGVEDEALAVSDFFAAPLVPVFSDVAALDFVAPPFVVL